MIFFLPPQWKKKRGASAAHLVGLNRWCYVADTWFIEDCTSGVFFFFIDEAFKHSSCHRLLLPLPSPYRIVCVCVCVLPVFLLRSFHTAALLILFFFVYVRVLYRKGIVYTLWTIYIKLVSCWIHPQLRESNFSFSISFENKNID